VFGHLKNNICTHASFKATAFKYEFLFKKTKINANILKFKIYIYGLIGPHILKTLVEKGKGKG